MISKTFKSLLAVAAIAVSVGSLASTNANAWGFHGGGGHFGGGGVHFGGGHFGGYGGGYQYRPRSYVYVGGGSYCGYGSHFSSYFGRCVPNYRPYGY